MLRNKKLFLVTMLICAFGFIVSCGNGNPGSTPETRMDELRREGIEFDYTMSTGIITQNGTIGGKGNYLWVFMHDPSDPSDPSIVSGFIFNINSAGNSATMYMIMDDYTVYTLEGDASDIGSSNQSGSEESDIITNVPNWSSFTKTDTANYAGITCDYYVGTGDYAGIEFAYYAEKDLTLYYKETTSQGNMEFQVTSISFGDDVTIPTIPPIMTSGTLD